MRIESLQVFLILLFAGVISPAAQQPFATDNADVTDKGKFHFEASSEYDVLQRSALPVKEQSYTRAQISYGLLKNVEISVQAPFLLLFNAADNGGTKIVGGYSDLSFGAKYNFRHERENSPLPALAVSAFLQAPTGSVNRKLGSGVTSYGFNGIAQKNFLKKNVARINAGMVVAGNTIEGVLGIPTVTQGAIFTGGGSLVRQFTEKLLLGAEVYGAVTNNFQLSAGQLQFQTGGNYQLKKNTTLDFGLVVGHFAASPRYGFKIGFSHDF